MSYRITRFTGRYFFLSNFYAAPTFYAGKNYLNSEAAFQSAKCRNIEDRKEFQLLQAREAKKLGMRVKLRSDWEWVKDGIMYEIVKNKFMEDNILRKKLLNTEDAYLVEGNTWHDNYWGNCICGECRNVVGKNKLGKILMDVRASLIISSDEIFDR